MQAGILLAEFEKPNNSELSGTNYRIDKNTSPWFYGQSGSWELRNIRYNDGSFDWANWECCGSGAECHLYDWATRWNGVRTSSPSDGWWENEDGEWEPPLPTSQGTWQLLYPAYFPNNYDPINDIYN